MNCLKLSTVLLVAFVFHFNSLDGVRAVPSRYSAVPSESDTVLPEWYSWQIPVLRKRSPTGGSAAFPVQEPFKPKSVFVKRAKCNTASCVTSRLAEFLSRTPTKYKATNVGPNSYGKRDSMGLYSREFFSYLER
ncbi:calcitonin gene-related peptide 1-like [Hypanus sabinus]|uniref:calcitonin gene-related peptide 1-like n=1 Tax=Hypanus sabinus TaxID=79690 RepID=UPI0028C39867|nr:calcitonin gene-related peptide 1-like [Hypanus sabinus]XP_059842881.1 calcitonin gene-related peptide 1-like [Hypanus sabinus]XP_059842882.1 calcitonin gene-related peptide 1-like [Hypanus sabinus]